MTLAGPWRSDCGGQNKSRRKQRRRVPHKCAPCKTAVTQRVKQRSLSAKGGKQQGLVGMVHVVGVVDEAVSVCRERLLWTWDAGMVDLFSPLNKEFRRLQAADCRLHTTHYTLHTTETRPGCQGPD